MSDAARPSPLRVLVVDDSHDTTKTMVLLLRLWGHDAREAHDGPAALETARTYLPQVVLLDTALRARMDGFDVARQLRTLPGLERALLICMSGYATEEDRHHSREAGFDHHFAKPADLGELQRLLAIEAARQSPANK